MTKTLKTLLIILGVVVVGGLGVLVFQNLILTEKPIVDEQVVDEPEEEIKLLEIITPKQGENLEAGKTYEIKWESAGIDIVNIWITGDVLYQDGTVRSDGCLLIEGYKCYDPCGEKIAEIKASDGKYSWTPEYGYVNGDIVVQEKVDDPENKECLAAGVSLTVSIESFFDIHYSFGPVHNDHSVDTRTNKYVYHGCDMERHSPSGSRWDVYKDEFDFRFTESERKKINDAIVNYGLLAFKETTFVDYCLEEGPCLSVDPPSQNTLNIIVEGKIVKTIKAETFLKKDEEYDRFTKALKVINDIISGKLETLNRKPHYCTLF